MKSSLTSHDKLDFVGIERRVLQRSLGHLALPGAIVFLEGRLVDLNRAVAVLRLSFKLVLPRDLPQGVTIFQPHALAASILDLAEQLHGVAWVYLRVDWRYLELLNTKAFTCERANTKKKWCIFLVRHQTF